ncbi:MAG TPA: argininosuccinate lyase [Terriglobales bacterium]|nr:argininosuccinate lyase [Terriglobales bacterium]
MKMWSGRFREPLDPEFDQWQRSFAFDRRLLPQELAASGAYAKALVKARVLNDQELGQILHALEQIGFNCNADPSVLDDADAEDIHHFVEQRLTELIGETAYKLHSGRSRNEQIATDLRLYAREQIDSMRSELLELVETLLSRAEPLGTAAMPAYTHLQKAEPVLAAHWLLAYVEMFFRDVERLADCRRRVNVLPLGSGAVAGTGLNLDRRHIARELGFDGVSANSMDATSDRDFEIEYLNALVILAVHLSRLAEEITIFSTAEFGFVILPESLSTGSSAMPQKKNPDATELLRAKAGRVMGAGLAAAVGMKGLPLAYNKDMQELQLPLFDASEATSSSLTMAKKLMTAVSFDTTKMQKAAASGFMNAMEAANYLVRQGVPFRRAHEAIGQAVRRCLDLGCELDSLSLEELKRIRPEFDQDFFSCLDTESVLRNHQSEGGTAPARVQEAIAAAWTRLRTMREEQVVHA